MKIPDKGASREEILARLEGYRQQDLRDSERTFAYVYDAGKAAKQVAYEAQRSMGDVNGLDPSLYPSVLQMENEIVAMAAAHAGDVEGVVGNFTSGGTESIFLAVKTARDWARANRPDVKQPKMVLPITAHPAHLKAAHYLCVEPVVVPVDPKTTKADPAQMEAAIDRDTILLVGSAPSYAHGVVDPIGSIGALAEKHGLLFHVDACIGGFLLPYLRRLGEDVPPFDFTVPGVTSLSMDLHKYAYAPKGASVLLHRSADLRRHQLFVHAEWPGYTMINTTVQSTKSAAPLAGAWAVLNFLGDEGYLELARKVRDATARLVEGIQRIEGLELAARPEMSLIAVTAEANPFVICDLMKKRGWYVQPQLACAGHRETLHLSVHAGNHDWVDPFLEDLASAVEEAKGVSMEVGGLTEALGGVDPASLTADTVRELMAMIGGGGDGIPEEMAQVNAILNALPTPLSERLIAEFVNQLYVPMKGEAS